MSYASLLFWISIKAKFQAVSYSWLLEISGNNCNLNLLCFLQSKVRGPVTGSPESMNTSRLGSPGQLLLQVPSGTYNLSESVRKRWGKVWSSVAAKASTTKLGLLLCEIITHRLSLILCFVFSFHCQHSYLPSSWTSWGLWIFLMKHRE